MPKSKKPVKRRSGAKRSRSSVGALAKVVKQLQAATPKAQALRRARYTRRLYRRYNAPGEFHSTGNMGAHIEQFKSQFPELEGLSNAEISKMIGTGGYWGRRFGNWLGSFTNNNTIKTALGNAGDMLGDVVGSLVPYGDTIASAAQTVAEAIPSLRAPVAVGGGAYALTSQPAMQVASFSAGDVESIRIRSREYLGPIKSSEALRIRQLLLNPGNGATFPQLSKLAMHYEMYRLNGLIFTYHTTSGESTNSVSTAIGEVIMVSNPDSTQTIPQTKYEMLRMSGASQGKPSVDQLNGVECAGNGVKYIRHGDPSEARGDPAKFDQGSFFIGVEGMAAGATWRIGELWVSYDIDLIRPRDSKGFESSTYHILVPNATPASLTVPAQGLSNTVYQDNIGITLAPGSAGVHGGIVAFPDFVNDGDFRVIMTVYGAPVAVGQPFNMKAPSIAGLVNCALLSSTPASYGNSAGSPTDNSVPTCTAMYTIRINAPGDFQASFSLSTDTIFPNNVSPGNFRLQIQKVPYGSATF